MKEIFEKDERGGYFYLLQINTSIGRKNLSLLTKKLEEEGIEVYQPFKVYNAPSQDKPKDSYMFFIRAHSKDTLPAMIQQEYGRFITVYMISPQDTAPSLPDSTS